MAYHPEIEHILAFGTDDGRVGIFNSIGRHNLNYLETVLTHPVYCLCWAPLPNTKVHGNVELFLYAVGNGQIIIYDAISRCNGNLYYVYIIIKLYEVNGKKKIVMCTMYTVHIINV